MKEKGGLATCASCGVKLIAPDDGQPYWCTACSYEDDLNERTRQLRTIAENVREIGLTLPAGSKDKTR